MKHRLLLILSRFVGIFLTTTMVTAIAHLVGATEANRGLQEPVATTTALVDRTVLAQGQFFNFLNNNLMLFLTSDLISQLLQGLLKTGLASAILVLGWTLINQFCHLLQSRLEALQTKYASTLYTKTLRIGSKEVLRPEQVTQFLEKAIRFSRFVVLLAIILIYANSILSFFPQTQELALFIFNSILNTIGQIFQAIVGYIPKFIFLVILCFITYYLLRFVNLIFREISEEHLVIPGFDPEWSAPTARITQVFIIAFAAVIAFPYLPGSDSSAFQGISIFLGVLLSLGSSSAVSNVIAGITLTYTRAFRLGDDIQVDDIVGTVIEKGLFVTRLVNYEGQFVSIPNSTILSSNVINLRTVPNPREKYPAPPMWTVEITVPLEVSWQEVHELLLKAARETPDVLAEPSPFVLNFHFNEDCMVYQLKAFTHTPGLYLGSVLRSKIQDELLVCGIDLESPKQLTISYSDQNYSATPMGKSNI